MLVVSTLCSYLEFKPQTFFLKLFLVSQINNLNYVVETRFCFYIYGGRKDKLVYQNVTMFNQLGDYT